MKINYWRIASIIVWSAFFIILGLTFYVGHFLPHGPSYPTGEIACQNFDRDCGELYKEDLSQVDIPSWAKFFRNNNLFLELMVLAVVGYFTSQFAKD